MYTQTEFTNDCLRIFDTTEGNIVDVPGIGEMVLYERPLIGFAAASDEIFRDFKRPEVIGANFMSPDQWLPGAKTVVTFFLPFTEGIRASNKMDMTGPSMEWLYGRIEGQEFIERFMGSLQALLVAQRVAVCVPSMDERFGIATEPMVTEDGEDIHIDSRWSERHAAFACGLGTFGISRGIITEKGMAGRCASLIVSAEWEPTARLYKDYEEYCVRCGACARNCPVGAITMEHGKNNKLCDDFVESTKLKYSPRYGCGKCQVAVPCEAKRP